MNLIIEKPGAESTVQGVRRSGLRHFGMPWAGPADEISHAIANRLVGNPAFAPAIEACLGGLQITFESAVTIALTGAIADAWIDQHVCPFHQTVEVPRGGVLRMSIPRLGVRSYLAIAGGIDVPSVMGSASTYLPSRIGGHHGRRLRAGDRLLVARSNTRPAVLRTPEQLRPFLTSRWMMRCTRSVESDWLEPKSLTDLFRHARVVSQRSNRMGLQLNGIPLRIDPRAPAMRSSPVFPGVLQCPPDGMPFALSVDAQTTGGYPRIASVLRGDRHRLGQLRPGDEVKLVEVSPDEATALLVTKRRALRSWIPNFEFA